jgi:hypothetical protein
MTKEELNQVESSARQWNDTLQHQEKMNVAIEQAEYNKFAMLKPKVGVDGNQYFVLYGEDLQSGIAGFGDTLYLAILDFNKTFHAPIKKTDK